MLVIGERIQVFAPRVRRAVDSRDKANIQALARCQVEAGADALDLNIGSLLPGPQSTMEWLVETVQEAMAAGLAACRRRPILNSVSAITQQIEKMLALAAQYGCDVVLLPIDSNGVPQEPARRIELALCLIDEASSYGIPVHSLYLDPIVLPIASNPTAGKAALESLRLFQGLYNPPIKTIVGLSNISYKAVPKHRYLINRVFLAMCLGVGLNAAILDPLDPDLMSSVRAIMKGDDQVPANRLLCAIAAGQELDKTAVDGRDPAQAAIWKALRVLKGEAAYDPAYLDS